MINQRFNISNHIKISLRDSDSTPLMMIFVASWSPFSEAVNTIAQKVKFVRNDIKVMIIDVDRYPEEKKSFSIRSVPTFIFIKNQEIKFKREKMMSKKEILQLI